MRKRSTPAAASQAVPAAIYARFSSHNQREESIEQQIAECKLYAVANNFKVVECYSDSAISGRTDRRPQYQRLKRDAERGLFRAIIAYKSNRISRNMMSALSFENEMDQLGITVHYAKEEFGNTASGRFALRTMMNVNQFFSENMGEDIKRNQRDNALNCRANGPAPYGYRSGDSGKFEIDEKTAPIVREIFTRIADGDTFAEISDSFNARGLRTSRGREWGKSSYQNIVRNERYMGIYIFEDVRVDGGMPRIIEPKLFWEVQRILEAGNKRKRRDTGDETDNIYMLTGKLFCGECGEHMIGMSGTSKTGTTHYYYACSTKRTGGDCHKKDVRKDQIEYRIALGIMERINKDAVIERLADGVIAYQKKCLENPDLIVLQDRLSENDKALRNLLKAIEAGVFTSTTRDRMLELENEQNDIKSQISLLKADYLDVTRDQIIEYLKSFRGGNINDNDYRKQLFDTFLVRVYLYDDTLFIIMDPYGKAAGFTSKSEIDSIFSAQNKGSPGNSAISESSTKLPCGSPQQSQANFSELITFGKWFAFSFPLT